jgi:hypothetical protein
VNPQNSHDEDKWVSVAYSTNATVYNKGTCTALNFKISNPNLISVQTKPLVDELF